VDNRTSAAGAKRFLFFPLGTVLGHFTRTLALAEELDAAGHEVVVAAGNTSRRIAAVLPPRMRLVATPEMRDLAARPGREIAHYAAGAANDRANIENASRMDPAEQRRRNERFTRMLARDEAILREVRPDAIITDYRFTVPLMRGTPPTPLFHISHILGFPSLHRRARGALFFPLDRGQILVPGVREIEYWRERPPAATAERSETLCGAFRWRGWERMQPATPKPRASDVFLFFGSTGNGSEIVPWSLRHISDRYRVRRMTRPGPLDAFLENTKVAICHGGHGTVMECIRHRTPMVLFPHNLEQLEIARRIEKMGLGVLVKRRFDELGAQELNAILARTIADERMRANLEKYSAILRRNDGAKHAAETVLRHLDGRGVAS
jgi:hypothetical protein